jgi:hypothetical protein
MRTRRNPRGPALLSRRRRWLTYLVLGGLWTTGAAWVVLRYGFERAGEFGATPHPLQPWALRAHALFAFAAIWLGGLIWAVHVVPNWRRDHRRMSGIVSIAALLVLVGSGYLLYYVADERWRFATSTLHWLLGLVAFVPFVVHLVHDRTPRDREHRSH